MITCPKCSKDNQDHYKFCLGCGAELPRDASPKAFSPQTPPHGTKAPSGFSPKLSPAAGTGSVPPARPAPVEAPMGFPPPVVPATVMSAPSPVAPVTPAPPVVGPPPAAPPAQGPLVQSAPPPPVAGGALPTMAPCPQCGHANAPTNLFCGACGYRLGGVGARPSAPMPAVVEATPAVIATLVVLRADGTEAGSFQLAQGTTMVGRETGGLFATDSYLSPRHATFQLAGNRLTVADEGSLNGVYRKLAREMPVELRIGDVFRIGQEIVKFEALDRPPASPDGVERLGAPSKGIVGRIALVVGRQETGNAFPVPETGIYLGRERGDVLFPEDGYVSGLHCRIAPDNGAIALTDLGSSNGTFFRLTGETELQAGDVLLMGQQLFRVNL